jgi:hypothetical protein
METKPVQPNLLERMRNSFCKPEKKGVKEEPDAKRLIPPGMTPSAAYVSIPANTPNAFSPGVQAGQQSNPEPEMHEVPGMAPAMPACPVPSGMANAFTNAGNPRPIPADMGMDHQPANAFSDGGMAVPPGYPGFPKPPQGGPAVGMKMPSAAAVAYASASPAWGPIGTLRESVLPSEREMAVEQLARCEWRGQPEVVHALVEGARSDPAPAVRASCVRALGKMGIKTPEVVIAVSALKSDSDMRVRQEVVQAIAILTAP